MHLGPPSDTNETVRGIRLGERVYLPCVFTQHGNLVKLTGAPHAYQVDQAYTMTLSLEHASNPGGGFFLSTEGVGDILMG
ncbi:MAG: hypothetical protein Ct9H90mP16_02650 [Candidatus Poseidoniales archaeon]|nr:MAG: hypothetical protein Ct9H90mP16_02650 [Candidatus Poseidoniales archaeon]